MQQKDRPTNQPTDLAANRPADQWTNQMTAFSFYPEKCSFGGTSRTGTLEWWTTWSLTLPNMVLRKAPSPRCPKTMHVTFSSLATLQMASPGVPSSILVLQGTWKVENAGISQNSNWKEKEYAFYPIRGFHVTQVSLIITQVKNKIAFHLINWVKKLKNRRGVINKKLAKVLGMCDIPNSSYSAKGITENYSV